MYYVMEIQEPQDGPGSYFVYTAETENDALSKFHYILYFAAISTVATHTALCVDEKGQYLARETFNHYVEPDPQPEPEPEPEPENE